MKIRCARIFAALTVVSALSACGTVVQESAMDWLQRQPVFVDNP